MKVDDFIVIVAAGNAVDEDDNDDDDDDLGPRPNDTPLKTLPLSNTSSTNAIGSDA